MNNGSFDIILVGGSSGSVHTVRDMLAALPADFHIPIFLLLHRMKNVESRLGSVLSVRRNICEPEDKEPIMSGRIYLAPQNYHLLIEPDKTISMDYSELVNYSRPSIDVTFMSASVVYRERTLGILLSGANKDGAEGINTIIRNGGRGIVQDPETTEFPAMPEAAIKKNKKTEVQSPGTIVDTLLSMA